MTSYTDTRRGGKKKLFTSTKRRTDHLDSRPRAFCKLCWPWTTNKKTKKKTQLNNFLIEFQETSQYLRNKRQKDKIKYEGTDGCPFINNFV